MSTQQKTVKKNLFVDSRDLKDDKKDGNKMRFEMRGQFEKRIRYY